MKKALIVSTVSGFVPQFEMNNIKILQSLGYEIHYASNYNTPSYGTDNKRLENTNIIQHQIDFVRSPFALKDNIKVCMQMRLLLSEISFDLVHCHTPMGGAITRIVAKLTKTKHIIYTVHGFHFYSGAPLLNWLIYYPTEKFLANMTDIIITINKEDYERATLFNAKKVVYIPGVGIDTKAILNISIDPSQKKKELGIAENTKIILSVGELIKRKNFETVVKAFAKADLSNTVLMICGHGCLEKKLRDIVKKLHIEHKVLFSGYRHDIYEIMKMSDVFFFPSYQEGLSVALMEAMAIGLPVICSKIRGNVDLIDHEKGGFLLSPTDIDGFACAMKKLISSPDLINEMKNYNMTKIKKFDVRYISESMSHIYS